MGVMRRNCVNQAVRAGAVWTVLLAGVCVLAGCETRRVDRPVYAPPNFGLGSPEPRPLFGPPELGDDLLQSDGPVGRMRIDGVTPELRFRPPPLETGADR